MSRRSKPRRPEAVQATTVNKQHAYSEYALGKISAQELAARIGREDLPREPTSAAMRILFGLGNVLLTPAWGRFRVRESEFDQ
jgi:hypothetical protein